MEVVHVLCILLFKFEKLGYLIVDLSGNDGFTSGLGMVFGVECLSERSPAGEELTAVEDAAGVDDTDFSDTEADFDRKFEVLDDVGIVEFGLDIQSGLECLATEFLKVAVAVFFGRRPDDDHGVACKLEDIAS